MYRIASLGSAPSAKTRNAPRLGLTRRPVPVCLSVCHCHLSFSPSSPPLITCATFDDDGTCLVYDYYPRPSGVDALSVVFARQPLPFFSPRALLYFARTPRALTSFSRHTHHTPTHPHTPPSPLTDPNAAPRAAAAVVNKSRKGKGETLSSVLSS